VLITIPNNRAQDHPGKENKQSPRTSVLSKLIGAVLLTLLIAVSSATPAPQRIEVKAARFSFEPAEITVKAGNQVDLVLTSDDVPHGLRIRELNINVKASKGKAGEVKFTPQKAGTFKGTCSVFCGSGHGKMTLTIHVAA
jgi:cytochrome c oxidase subunit 2